MRSSHKRGWSVWPTGQRQARIQRRRSHYRPESTDHPAKMLPAIARHAIRTYTRPGELVLDPLCGIGTSLVEASALNRRAVGIELEPRWAAVARANLEMAAWRGVWGEAEVYIGDAREVASKLARTELAGQVSLLVTSPPYGAMTHGQVRTRRDGASGRVEKWSHRYSLTRDTTQLAHQRPPQLLESFTAILAACRALLCPGAHVVITTRPYRGRGMLVDFPGQVASAAQAAGLVLIDRCVALLCGLRGEQLVSRASFFQMVETRRLRDAGVPAHIIAHEDVLILTTPDNPRLSQPKLR